MFSKPDAVVFYFIEPVGPDDSIFGQAGAMSRRLDSALARHLAATLLVVFVSVSVVDIDDYDVHPRFLELSLSVCVPGDADQKSLSASPTPESRSEHICACLLCVTAIPESPGPRVLPLSAGKMSTPLVAALMSSPHRREVYHPPSA